LFRELFRSCSVSCSLVVLWTGCKRGHPQGQGGGGEWTGVARTGREQPRAAGSVAAQSSAEIKVGGAVGTPPSAAALVRPPMEQPVLCERRSETTCTLNWPRKGLDAPAAKLDAAHLGQNAFNKTSRSVARRVPTSINEKDETANLSTVDGRKNRSASSETLIVSGPGHNKPQATGNTKNVRKA